MGMDWGLWIVKLVKHQSKAHCWAWQMAHCLRIRIRGHLIDTFLAIWLRTRSSVGRNYVLAVGGAGGCRKLNSSSCSMRSNLILIVVVNGAWLVHWAHLIGNVESLIGFISNWKFIGSSKLLIENEPNEVPPPLVRQLPFGPICSIYRIVS